MGLVAALALSIIGSGTAVARKDDQWLRLLQRQVNFTTGRGKGSPPGASSIQRAFTALVRDRGNGKFLALTTAAESAPRLYGLCGLRHLGAPEYDDVRRHLSQDLSVVSGLVGCIRLNDTVGGVLAHEYGKSGRTVFEVVCDDLVVR